MTAWSKPSHKLATSGQEELPDDFKFGIELSLGQLIEMRNKPIIQWLDPNSKVKTNRIGGFRSRFKGRGMDFDESRIYQMGDDIRNINWKATAKRGQLMVNQFQDEKSQPIYSIIDKGRVMKMPFNSLSLLDYAINATLVISSIALKKNDKAGMFAFSNKIENNR